jgi:hypothetical protein
VNGFDLGYAEAGRELEVGELTYTEDEILSFAWLNKDYDVGEEYRIALDDVELGSETIVPQNIEDGNAVGTGVPLSVAG